MSKGKYWFKVAAFDEEPSAIEVYQTVWGRISGKTAYNLSIHRIVYDDCHHVIVHGESRNVAIESIVDRLTALNNGRLVDASSFDQRILTLLRQRRQQAIKDVPFDTEIRRTYTPGLSIWLDDDKE